MEKVLIIYHKIDIDGWLSAAIANKYFQEETSMDITLLGYNYNDQISIPLIVKKYDNVVIVDVSLTLLEMRELSRGVNLTYIDHHKAKVEEIIADKQTKMNYHINKKNAPILKKAACELTFEYFYEEIPLPSVVEYASSYDCFRHKAYNKNTQMLVLFSQYGLRSEIYNVKSATEVLQKSLEEGVSDLAIDKYIDSGKYIYKYLQEDAKLTYEHTKTINIDGVVCGIINKERFNPFNFDIDYHQDGFDAYICYHRAADKWNFSIYNENGEVDCSDIAKKFGGGGHPGASGFRTDSIDLFLEETIIIK